MKKLTKMNSPTVWLFDQQIEDRLYDKNNTSERVYLSDILREYWDYLLKK